MSISFLLCVSYSWKLTGFKWRTCTNWLNIVAELRPSSLRHCFCRLSFEMVSCSPGSLVLLLVPLSAGTTGVRHHAQLPEALERTELWVLRVGITNVLFISKKKKTYHKFWPSELISDKTQKWQNFRAHRRINLFWGLSKSRGDVMLGATLAPHYGLLRRAMLQKCLLWNRVTTLVSQKNK